MATYSPFRVSPATPHAGPPRVAFSAMELRHLAGAVAVLTVCFALAVRFGREAVDQAWRPRFIPDPIDLMAAFLAVSTGFILHELAHKVVAQRYGHWAEFRAQFTNLLFSYILVAFSGLLFAAPGAVLIQGAVTRRENGVISLVGPATNFLIAVVAWPLGWATDADALRPRIFGVVAFANILLCLFNLLPFGPLDGRKVLAWSKGAYFGALAVAIALFVAVIGWRHGF